MYVIDRLVLVLCAIDRYAQSIDRAALSMDPLLAQPSIDGAALTDPSGRIRGCRKGK